MNSGAAGVALLGRRLNLPAGTDAIESYSTLLGEALTRRAELLTQSAKTARQMDTRTAARFYAAIRDQIPKDGYIRALSASEVNTILKEGRMGRGYDFTSYEPKIKSRSDCRAETFS